MKKKIIYISIAIVILIAIIITTILLISNKDKTITIDYIKVGEYNLKMGTYEGTLKEYNPDEDKYDEETIEIFIDDKQIKLSDEQYTYTIKDNTITANGIVLEVISNTEFIYQIDSGVNMKLVKGYSITKEKESTSSDSKYKIVDSETKQIEYETFDNGLVSMQIPKGWEVTIYPNCDAIHYTFIVTNPENRNYQLFFNMKSEGFLSTEKERQWYASLYPDTVFAILPAMDPMTTEHVFQVFNEYSEDSGDFINPKINDFTKIDSLGTTSLGGEVIRGTYTNENNEKVEGIFTSNLKKYSLYYVYTVALYSTSFYTVPDGELTNWEPILNKCMESITFSDTLVETINIQESIISQSISDVARITSETTDIINSGWEERQATYDIISQKQSDATLGYERVYDTETGDIYKAYNGFTDGYYGNRYQTITDDMYTLPISGYIELK